MYQSIFRNTSALKQELSDDEYDLMWRVWSLLIRLNLEEDPQSFDKESDLLRELDDFARRCRLGL